jgi:putative spermidine/putrescine transport system permease protein
MPESAPLRAPHIRRDMRREQAAMLLLVMPSLAIMAALLLAPLCWLIGMSFVHGGLLSLANYQRIFTDAFYAQAMLRTLGVAMLVTLITAVCGYVIAYAITLMPRWASGVCLMLVALPFWTSALVRTYSWLVLLQNRGLVNTLLLKLEVIDQPLQLVNSLSGTYVGMVHIMLPMMVFPIYAVLRRIDPNYMRAALSFGASQTYAFWRVYFPLSKPGLAAGSLIVFVLSLGFYITPALLGGGRVAIMSTVIERDVNFNRDWGPASAMSALFVLVVLAIFVLGSRAVSFERMFQR